MAFSQDVIDTITSVATARNLEPAALLAVVEVESNGTAYATVGGKAMPLILYEYHVFYRWPGLTADQREAAVRQRLAAKNWRDLPYASGQTARYAQLAKAAQINEQAAYAACSWGVGQVLGENAGWLGYGTPKALADKAMSGLAGQVEVMLAFVDKAGLADELGRRDWSGFARGYNGVGQVSYYAGKMATAYQRFAAAHGGAVATPHDPVSLKLGMRGEPVARLQRLLRALGYALVVDGDFGPATRRMVTQFQTDQGLQADGIAGPLTLARIEALTHQFGPNG